MVARLVRDQKAAGSNPATSTQKSRKYKASGVFVIPAKTRLSFAIVNVVVNKYCQHIVNKTKKKACDKATKKPYLARLHSLSKMA